MPTCFLPLRLSSSYPSLSWLLPCRPWSPRKQLWTMCAACPRAGACTVACRVRVQFSGNELLKTGSWAHDITTSLSLTAKTNSGNCFGLCWISMPPWLLLIHWEGDACCWSVRLKKAGRGLARGAAKLESSRLGKAWWNVAKGEWFLTAQLSSGNHQWEAVRVCGSQKYFTLGSLWSEVMSQDGRREKSWGHQKRKEFVMLESGWSLTPAQKPRTPAQLTNAMKAVNTE